MKLKPLQAVLLALFSAPVFAADMIATDMSALPDFDVAAATAEAKVLDESYLHPTVFTITSFHAEGDAFMTDEKLNKLLKPYIGDGKTVKSIDDARHILQAYYSTESEYWSDVNLPEQEITSGEVKFQVMRKLVNGVKIVGNHIKSQDAILKTIPALRGGQPISVGLLQKQLALANENPARRIDLLMTPLQTSDGSDMDATLNVASDDKEWRAGVIADNTGDDMTGSERVTAFYQNFNITDRDDQLTLQFTTTPEDLYGSKQFSRVKALGISYTLPLYDIGDVIELSGGYSDVDGGTVNNVFNVSGSGIALSAKYRHPIGNIGDYRHQVFSEIEYHDYRSKTDFFGINLTPEVSTTPVSIGYMGDYKSASDKMSLIASASRNIPVSGYGKRENLEAFPYSTDANFLKASASMEWTHTFTADWKSRVRAAGQLSGDHMLDGDQFGVGGARSVRGLSERAVRGDSGYFLSAEAITPDIGTKISPKISLRGVLFYDLGFAKSNKDVLGNTPDIPGRHVSSAGVGIRFGYGKNLFMNADLARVIEGDKIVIAGSTTGSKKSGDLFLHFSFGWIW